ncbi:MAG: tyrosine-type recombinase/integrase [Boseongicola sp. SB0673_bin_14]|nr:tyrosine-type recombinase/integrase [Boseongicola sp. SB0673_bin_14]
MHLRDSKTGPRIVWLSTSSRDVLDGLPKTSRWVFPSPRTRGPVSKTAVESHWFRMRSDAGLNDVRLHDLRHTYASLAVMTGETVPVVGRLLGHKDSETTLKYAHLSETAVRDAADMMGIFLEGKDS